MSQEGGEECGRMHPTCKNGHVQCFIVFKPNGNLTRGLQQLIRESIKIEI